MARGSVSIQDIAKVAGVSHSTVSRALRNSPHISVAVKAHIQKLANEMGYTPNAIAQSLQMRRTNTIGIVVTSIGDPFWSDVVRGAETVAQAHAMSLFLSSAYADPDQELAAIEQFHRRRVDGILIADAHLTRGHAERLNRMRVPSVLINCQADSLATNTNSVTVDDTLGARLAVEHLIELGHRRIGYLGVTSRPLSNTRRYCAYREALANAGIEAQPAWVNITEATGTDDTTLGCALAESLLHSDVTAIFCYNDMLAIGALLACRSAGMIVPDAISIVGYDDIPAAQYVTPALTTIQQPRFRLGELAMQMLLDLLADRPITSTMVAPTCVIRQSTGQPHAPLLAH
jgi:DNA-binding LacI/PurR family transcriptional regulator